MSKHRKALLKAAGALAVLYLVWLSTNIMNILPEGPWSRWYVGFGILGVATALAFVALRKSNTEAARSDAAPTTRAAQPHRRAGQTTAPPAPRRGPPNVFSPTDGMAFEAPAPPPSRRPLPQAAQDPEDFYDDEDDSGDQLSKDGNNPPYSPRILTPAPSSVAPPPMGAEVPGLLPTADLVGGFGASPAPVNQATVLDVSDPSSHDPRALTPPPPGANWGDPRGAQPEQSKDNIQIMASYASEPSPQSERRNMEDASLQSIDAAIRQYTVELYDVEEHDDLSRTMDEVLNIQAMFQQQQTATAQTVEPNPNDSSLKKSRLEALRNKLGSNSSMGDALGQNPGDSGLGNALNPAGPASYHGASTLEELLSVAAPTTSAPSSSSPLPDNPQAAPDAPYMSPAQAANAAQDIHGVVLEPFLTGFGAMDRDELNELWQNYVETSLSCGKPPSKLKYRRFYRQLQQHHDAIQEQYACSSIRFRIKIKNGKPALSARPA